MALENHESKAAGEKASYAQEPAPAKGKRPSRKSTRKSANRAKADTNLTLRASRAKRAPTEQARASKRKSAAVRRTTTKG